MGPVISSTCRRGVRMVSIAPPEMVLLVRSAPPGRAGRVPGGCPGFCVPHGTLNTAPAGAEAVICRWMFYSSWVSKPAPVSTWTLAKPAALTCWAAFSYPKVRPSTEWASAVMMTLPPIPAHASSSQPLG